MRFAIFDMEGLFHVHSNYSSDGRLSLEQLREECVKRNLQFVVVTDHAEDFSQGMVNKFVDHCNEVSDKGFWIIPGLEFVIDKERQVHLLVVGIDESSSEIGPANILESVQEAKNNTLAVVAHLSRSDHYIPPEYEKKIHGIEIWNAAYDSRYLPDHKAINLFWNLKKKNLQLVGFGGLDLHDNSGFRGLSLRVAKTCRNPQELVFCLKKGNFEIHGPYMRLSSTPRMGIFWILMIGAGRSFLMAVDNLQWKIKGLTKKVVKSTSGSKTKQKKYPAV